MRSSVVRRCLSLGVLMVLSGCATMRHRDAVYNEAHKHVYTQPIEKVWPELVRLMSAEGYPPRKGNDEFVLITEWRNDTQESRIVSSISRVYAEGYRVDNHTSAVRIFKQTVFTGNRGGISARENRVGSLVTGAAGDISPFAEDPIKLSHMMDSSSDHTPLTRSPEALNRSAGRDGELEWKLLQRVDLAAAEAIEARITSLEQE
jgi:hypothetical protein